MSSSGRTRIPFNTDEASLAEGYRLMYDAYTRILYQKGSNSGQLQADGGRFSGDTLAGISRLGPHQARTPIPSPTETLSVQYGTAENLGARPRPRAGSQPMTPKCQRRTQAPLL